jgi:hypothetical protein
MAPEDSTPESLEIVCSHIQRLFQDEIKTFTVKLSGA